MELKINEVIRQRRRTMDISQETLADHLGVSVQAVSKWETNASYPDITLLPKIAEYLGTDLNVLFFGKESEQEETVIYNEIPDDGKLRVVQFLGNKVLSQDDYDPKIRIMLKTPTTRKSDDQPTVNVEIWGSADIEGYISGDLVTEQGANCGDVEGDVNAGGGVNCGDVEGDVNSGGGVNCGDVEGDVNAGGGVHCGGVEGNVKAGGGMNCGDVEGNVNAGRDVNCGNIDGNAKAENDIHCKKINGDAECGGSIIYEND